MAFAICRWVPDFSSSMVEQFASNGVTAIEPGPAFLYRNDGTTAKPEAERLRKAGIRIYACHAPFEHEDDLSILDEQTRQKAVQRLQAALRQTAVAGGECLIIHPSTAVGPEEGTLRLGKLLASLETLIPAAEKAGVMLALENMIPNHVGFEPSSVLSVVGHFRSPFLRVCFDTGHANLSEEGVYAGFDAVKDFTIAVHLHDNDGHQDRHLQPPYGMIDWHRLCQQICRCGFRFPLTIEAPPWARSTYAVQLREVSAVFEERVALVPWEDRTVRMVCEKCRHCCIGTSGRVSCACDS